MPDVYLTINDADPVLLAEIADGLELRASLPQQVEILETYPFQSNQAVVFAKTFNSWHCVRPMTGPDAQVWRRSLTINIEAH